MTAAVTEPALSPDQQVAHDSIIAWFKDRKRPLLTLGGFAGSGKTTILARIARTPRKERRGLTIAFVAFTGKAASVLKTKLTAAGALQDDYCGTIHGYIYAPMADGKGGVRFEKLVNITADLIILDEASMVDEVLFKDLQSYGKPILAVGDHGQLPPINGAFNLMERPELRLEKIHRQAADNPIIKASMLIRETGQLPYGDLDGSGRVVKTRDKEALLRLAGLRDAMVICGTNRTRTALNAKIRAFLGYQGPPAAGERVICLRNNRLAGIYNGMGGVLTKIEPSGEHWWRAIVAMEGRKDPFIGKLNRRQFGSLTTLTGTEIPGLDPRNYGERFDFGYAITCHKSQGSQAAQVVVFDECYWLQTEDLRRRWAYTAVTRASERLLVVAP